MDVQRTVTIGLPEDADLRATLEAFQQVLQSLSPIAFNKGQPLAAPALQRVAYHQVKGTVNAQMTISAIRRVASAYRTAQRNRRPAKCPFRFLRRSALFLIGKRGRDADFRRDGTLSIWTVAGRKRLAYTIPSVFQDRLNEAVEIDSLTVIERQGRLLGRVVVTLRVPEPEGTVPVGVDLNETNAIVAVDASGRELFISGKAIKVKNRRTAKTYARLQRKLATRKAEHEDTRGVRRVLKRLGRQRSNRTRTFAQTAAKQLVTWAPPNAVLVFEDLRGIPAPACGAIRGTALRRRLAVWQRRQIRQAAQAKAEERGLLVAEVDPRYTSQTCSCCGLRGRRTRHVFRCPTCGLERHADVNAAINIRQRYTVLRHGGPSSTGPEAQAPAVGKSSPSGVGG